MQDVVLSEQFLSKYRYKNPKWGFDGLGYIIYLRTYARTKEDGNLERWDETVERITNGNFKIEVERLRELGKLNDERIQRLIREMERFYHLVFNLVITPPGRGLWMSGTPYAEKVGDAENNCWGISMKPIKYGETDDIRSFYGRGKKVSFAPVFTFDQAMKGGGVGVNIQRKYVEQIPEVSRVVDILFVCDEEHPDFKEMEELGVKSLAKWSDYFAYERRYYHVADSREGWAEILGLVIDAHYEESVNGFICIDVSNVRAKGLPIKGFGGVASGPGPLVKLLDVVNAIINNKVWDYVSCVEWGDIIQNIGCCVVSGNVRRTALILIGDRDDEEYIKSKNYSLSENKIASQWRWASNNSVDISSSTSRKELRNLATNIYYNGEPGYTNIDLARNFGRIIDGFQQDIDGDVEVFNPCGEVTLPSGSPCNLFEVNLPKIHELVESGAEPHTLYGEVFYLAERYAYRITFRNYQWKITRDMVSKHRRLGVGITGITDWVLLRYGSKAISGFNDERPLFNDRVCNALDKFYSAVRDANKRQAKELESEISIKVTTVKPSGTISLLMGVSPGQHYHWSKWMIRRVRISSNAPLVPILEKCGYKMEPAIKGFNVDGPVYDHSTIVVEFPVKAPTADCKGFQSAGDVPLREQAALQCLLQTYWADNSVSATLSFHKPTPKPVYFEDGTVLQDKFGNTQLQVHPEEEKRVIEEITNILDLYKGTIKSTTFLPYSTDTYPQMPYEKITEEQYIKMVGRIEHKPWELIGDIEAEKEDTTDTSTECIGGACPIK